MGQSHSACLCDTYLKGFNARCTVGQQAVFRRESYILKRELHLKPRMCELVEVKNLYTTKYNS